MADDALLAGVLEGKVAAIARAVSVVENARPGFESLLAAIHPQVGSARRIGITGPPGAGKSTLIERLVTAFRAQGFKVAVIAVDPTSPFTGGALLGDRIRMESIALDPGVYIRSMATRGSLGGLTTSAREVCDVLDAAGFERILVETVGVGQSELDIASLADSTVVTLVPESGDGIQTLKSGVMEIADLFVINKADRIGADKMRREVEVALDLRTGVTARHVPAHHGALKPAATPPTAHRPPFSDVSWRPPVLLTAAAKGEGTAELLAELDRHWEWMNTTGELVTRRRHRLAQRTREVINRAVQRWVWRESHAEEAIAARLDDVVAGATNPYEVATEIMATLKDGVRV